MNIEKDYEYILNEYRDAHFNKESGLEADKLTELVKEYFDSHKDIPPIIRRAETLRLLLENCQIEVNIHTPFADKYNIGINYDRWATQSPYEVMLRNDLYREYNEKCHEAWQERGHMYDNGLGAPDNDVWHTTADWEYLFEKGIKGIRDEAEQKIKETTGEQQIFYQGISITYNAILMYMQRLEKEAHRVGHKQFEECIKYLQNNPPKTLYQAMEFSLLYMSIEEIGIERCRTLGNINLYYKDALKYSMPTMSQEDFENLIAYFLLKINSGKRYADQPICVGGLDKDGNCPADDFSLTMLRIYHKLQIANPKLHIRYNKKMRDDIYEEICRCIHSGSSSMVLISDEMVMKGYKKIGINEDESYAFLPLGCYENVISNVEDARICSCWINLTKPVEWAITGGQEINGKAPLFPYKELKNDTWVDFLNNYLYYLKEITERVKKNVCEQERVARKYYPSPVLSGALRLCMEKGKDIFDHALKYNNSSMKYCCTGSAIDSLLAIKKFVYEKKLITLEEMKEALQSNWENKPEIRALILHDKDKFGSGSPVAGELAEYVFSFIEKILLNKPNGYADVYRLGTDSVENSDTFGFRCGASADGRLQNTPFSKNMRPVNGMEYEGITGFMRNMLQIKQDRFIDGSPLDFMIHPSAVQGEKGFAYFKNLIRYYLENGGNTIMGNVVNVETLIDAQKHPENYQNLQVRVCGWNEYFVQMSTLVQNDFIERAKGIK